MLCVITDRTESGNDCFEGRAGIQKMWVNSASKVTALTIDATTREITAITASATVGDGFKLLEFQPDTAFFNQAKTRTNNNRGGVNVVPTISFNFDGVLHADLTYLENLNSFKNLHVIVLDNNGKYWYVGINYFDSSATWASAGLRTGEGSANSGADPAADAAETNETLTCNQNWYAREYTGAESAIPVN